MEFRITSVVAFAFFFVSCISQEPVNYAVGKLMDNSLGTFQLDGESRAMHFLRTTDSLESSRLIAYSPADFLLYEIAFDDSVIAPKALCKIENYQRFFAYFFDDCSSLRIDSETGFFSLQKDGSELESWNFPGHAPQIIPNQGMEVHSGEVYILNSSYNHQVSEIDGARAYFRDIQPVIKFRLADPVSSVQAMGGFPSSYVEADGSIMDLQPHFCVNNDSECVLSFRYADSLYFAEEKSIKAISCKSAFYTPPQFLTFEDAESMSNVRKFDAESSMYLWVKYNPFRKEYYRFCKHASKAGEKVTYSIIVLDSQLKQTAELTFDFEDYALTPLVNTRTGFMMINQKESMLKKKYCFESFGL